MEKIILFLIAIVKISFCENLTLFTRATELFIKTNRDANFNNIIFIRNISVSKLCNIEVQGLGNLEGLSRAVQGYIDHLRSPWSPGTRIIWTRLFNSCERLLLGTLILDIDIAVECLRSEQIVRPYLLHNGEQTKACQWSSSCKHSIRYIYFNKK